MKKLFGFILVLTFAVVLAACGNGDKGSDDKKITVGASPAPHAEILEKAKPLLEKKVTNLKLKQLTIIQRLISY